MATAKNETFLPSFELEEMHTVNGARQPAVHEGILRAYKSNISLYFGEAATKYGVTFDKIIEFAKSDKNLGKALADYINTSYYSCYVAADNRYDDRMKNIGILQSFPNENSEISAKREDLDSKIPADLKENFQNNFISLLNSEILGAANNKFQETLKQQSQLA